MISNVIATQFGASLNWPLGSALALVMLVIVLAIISVSDRFERLGKGGLRMSLTAAPSTVRTAPARRTSKQLRKAVDAWVWVGVAGLILTFLYIPIVVLVAFSFNTSRSLSWPMTGLTLDWYRKLAENDQLITAVQNSLYVAVVGDRR